MEPVTVSIQGAGLSFNAQTDFFKAGQIIAFLNSPQSSQAGNSSSSITTAQRFLPDSSPRKSPREAILSAGASTNAQKIAVLAQYILQDGAKRTFNSAEIKPLFARAGEPTPKNFSRDMQDAVRACYIFESLEQSGEYELSEKVHELINTKFQSETDKVPRKKTGNRTSSGGKKEINASLKELEYVTHMEGLTPFHSLTTKGQKILWILAYAKNNGVDALSTSEVEFIANKLNDNITTSMFSGLNEGNEKRGYVSRKNDKYKILQSGIDAITAQKN